MSNPAIQLTQESTRTHWIGGHGLVSASAAVRFCDGSRLHVLGHFDLMSAAVHGPLEAAAERLHVL